jgi:hypothetical protein
MRCFVVLFSKTSLIARRSGKRLPEYTLTENRADAAEHWGW